MKRKTKNIICIILILLMCSMNYFVINYEHINNEKSDIKSNLESNNSDNILPPEKLDNNSEDNALNKPSNDSNTEIKDKNDDSNVLDRLNNNQQNQNKIDINKIDTSLNKEDNIPIYIIIFGIVNLVIAIIIIYLIMSKFNKKTFKETFPNSDKVTIEILAAILLTVGLTYIDVIIKNNLNNTSEINDPNTLNYNSKIEINENKTITNETYESTNEDENTISVTGNVNVEIISTKINKTGDSSGGDTTSFYGTNSAIIAKDGSNLTINNATINTSAVGANGVFSYGGNTTNNETKIIINDSIITTTKDNSGGIMTTGGGTMIANNLVINTSGISSAAIRSDRGGGTVNVNGGEYTTNGQGSPSIYSTANITVSNAKLVSNSSEGIVVEGKNSVTLNNVELIDTNNKLNGKSTTYKNIFLYQSMSGDASEGESIFTSVNSKIITNKGDTIYVTNTKATINLTNNIIVNNDSTGSFLRIQSDSWGIEESNGGDVTLTLTNQGIVGDIIVDKNSKLDMKLSNSNYEGTINNENTSKQITLTLDKNSTLKLTNDSYITTLNNDDELNSNIDFNGYKLYVNGNQIN